MIKSITFIVLTKFVYFIELKFNSARLLHFWS